MSRASDLCAREQNAAAAARPLRDHVLNQLKQDVRRRAAELIHLQRMTDYR